MKRLLVVLGMLLILDMAAETLLRLPPIVKPPVIDGRIEAAEWIGGSIQSGAVSRTTQMIVFRQVTFYFAYDEKNIYFGQRSEKPPLSLTPEQSGDILITLTPPDATKSFTFSARRDGAVFTVDEDFWMSEQVIPLEKLGLNEIEYGKPWKLQMTRQWENRREFADWSSDGAGIFIPEKNIPAVNFIGMGENYLRASYNIRWTATTATGKYPVLCEANIVSVEEPRTLVENKTATSENPASFHLFLVLRPGVIRTFNMELRDPKSNRVYYKRSFQWDAASRVHWHDPAEPFLLQIGAYPTYKKVKARIYCNNSKKVQDLKSVEFQIVDEAGKIHSKVQPEKRKRDFYKLWNMPELPDGKYFIRAVYTDVDDKSGKVEDYFTIRKFAWQGLNLGREQLIIPPFVPLKASDTEIHALQTGYRVDGILWDRIYAQGENILAAPVELVVNGEKFTGQPPKKEKAEPGQVIFQTQGAYQNLIVKAKHEYDYDGMCKVTMRFEPSGNFKFNKLYLDIPLKGEYAKFFHSVGSGMRENPNGELPPGEGRIWDSRTAHTLKWTHYGSFRPYIWFGETYKGLSWFCESPLHWTISDPKIPAAEIIRKGSKVTLRLNIFHKERNYTKPFEIVMGFQPTPVKPRPVDFRRYHGVWWGSERAKVEGADIIWWSHSGDKKGMHELRDGWFTPPNNDWSYFDFQWRNDWKDQAEAEAVIKDYCERNNLTNDAFFTKWRGKIAATRPDNDIQLRMWQGCRFRRDSKFYLNYYNCRALSPDWAERDMYVDEWYMGAWRPSRDWLDEYNCDPSDPNYADFLLYHGLRQIRWGTMGIYYDNIYERFCSDVVLGARQIDEEVYLPVVPIFGMRDFLKRTATMLASEQKFISGRPALFYHTTNVNVVPWNSWAAVGLDFEMNFGTKPYPERFSDAHVHTISLGTQCGLIPATYMKSEALVNSVISRSLLAFTFANDLMYYFQAGPHPSDRRIINAIYQFGYGNPDFCTVYPGYDTANNPVKSDSETVRVTTVKRWDGGMLLMVGNLHKACQVNLTLPGNYRTRSIKNNVVTDGGDKLSLKLTDYDYDLIELTPEDK